MADSVKYPLTTLRFEVQWSGGNASFQEVGGLDMSTEVIEYRGGMDTTLTTRKVPGLMKYSNITLQRGIIAKDNDFFDWWTKNQQGAHEQRDITINLMDEGGTATVTWSIVRAWPTKVEAPGMNAKGNEIAIEKLEFCHEGVTVKAS